MYFVFISSGDGFFLYRHYPFFVQSPEFPHLRGKVSLSSIDCRYMARRADEIALLPVPVPFRSILDRHGALLSQCFDLFRSSSVFFVSTRYRLSSLSTWAPSMSGVFLRKNPPSRSSSISAGSRSSASPQPEPPMSIDRYRSPSSNGSGRVTVCLSYWPPWTRRTFDLRLRRHAVASG